MQRVLREYGKHSLIAQRSCCSPEIGDVVRVAPNELVFITPKAYTGMLFPSSLNEPYDIV